MTTLPEGFSLKTDLRKPSLNIDWGSTGATGALGAFSFLMGGGLGCFAGLEAFGGLDDLAGVDLSGPCSRSGRATGSALVLSSMACRLDVKSIRLQLTCL